MTDEAAPDAVENWAMAGMVEGGMVIEKHGGSQESSARAK
jgi:hypothetical protein